MMGRSPTEMMEEGGGRDEEEHLSATLIEMRRLLGSEEGGDGHGHSCSASPAKGLAMEGEAEGERVRQRAWALNEWKRTENLDRLLERIYAYYEGNGMSGILIDSASRLVITAFAASFSIFLLYSINWDFISQPATAAAHPTLWGVIDTSRLWRMPLFSLTCALAFAVLWVGQAHRAVAAIPDLVRMHRFYTELLGIPDANLAGIDFGDIVEALVALHRRYPICGASLDAHDICNRLMRRDNYMIALFNRGTLGLTLPALLPPSSRGARIEAPLSQTLEWNISFAIMSFVFDEASQVRKSFLNGTRREALSQELRKRLVLVGLANVLLAPFIGVLLVFYSFFRYAEEIYRHPHTIGLRQYGCGARWKLREYNELPHYLARRLANSHRSATKYMNSFANGRVISLVKAVSFVAGSFAAVLIGVTVANEDLLMHFEVTPGKSIIWYLGAFGVVLAVTRSIIPDVTRTSDPSRLMAKVAEYTHYAPPHWAGRLHTEAVRREFGALYDYKFLSLAKELLSVAYTPYLLLAVLPSRTDAIIDFFREFTVHHDRLGHVCSFALFDFARHGDARYGSGGGTRAEAPPQGGADPTRPRAVVDKHQQSREGKMEKSFLNFVSNNPRWRPSRDGHALLARLQDFEEAQRQRGESATAGRANLVGSAVFRSRAVQPFVGHAEEADSDLGGAVFGEDRAGGLGDSCAPDARAPIRALPMRGGGEPAVVLESDGGESSGDEDGVGGAEIGTGLYSLLHDYYNHQERAGDAM